MQKSHDTINPIIAIGASAGALDTLEKFFASIPPDSNYTFVVIQHLSANHKSMMDELLSRKTTLPIKVLENNTEIEKGHIYLNPPKQFIEIEGNKFKLVPQPKEGVSFPISHFLESLSVFSKNHCAAIIISGTGSDGSDGIKFIKNEGGLTLAQDPEEAAFDGMPVNAIKTGMVDLVCKTNQMYTACHQYFHFHLNREEIDIDQSIVNSIIRLIKQKLGYDFSGYKETTLKRRISRRMDILAIADLNKFVKYLKNNHDALQHLAQDLMIGVTKLFRDEEAFQALQEQAIPNLLKHAKETGEIRVWVTGCSTGEEAYSIAILILEEIRKSKSAIGLTVFASDINQQAIKNAGNRYFSTKSFTALDQNLINTYFTKEELGYKPIKKLRDLIVFSKHNVLTDPPFSKIDLLCCRNMLIYYKAEVQENLMHLFRYALRQDGVLFLGSSETLGKASSHFTELDKKWKLFSNDDHLSVLKTSHKFKELLTANNLVDFDANKATNISFEKNQDKVKAINIQEALVQRYAPNALVFDEAFNLLHIVGNAGQYLQYRAGKVSNNLLNLLPEDWVPGINIATKKALKTETSVTLDNIAPDANEKLSVRIDLVSAAASSFSNNLIVAAFNSLDSKSDTKEGIRFENYDINKEAKEKIRALESELLYNKESLQSTIEELESSNEELQSSNEELQSSNEELESVNEELYTVNAEYQKKTEELAISNNDLNNLFQNSNISILFLDSDLKIRKFTPSLKRILNLDANDTGRYIGDLKTKIELDQYFDNFKEVMGDLTPFELQVQSSDSKIFVLKASPFITSNNKIEGIIITLYDISELKETQSLLNKTAFDLEKSKSYREKDKEIFELVEEHLSDLMCIHNREGIYQYVSPSVKDLLGYTPDELVGKNPYDYFHPDDMKRIAEESHGKVLNKLKNVIEYRMRKKDGSYTWLETTNQFITDSRGRVTKILTTSRDVSHRKKMEAQLLIFSEVVKHAQIGICILNEKGEISNVNHFYAKMIDKTEGELLDRNYIDSIKPILKSKEKIDEIQKAIRDKEIIKIDIRYKIEDATTKWLNMIFQPLEDSNGHLEGYFIVQQDITNLKVQETNLKKLNVSLEGHNSQLQEVNKELEDFAYIISHDLKEPLRGIQGLLGLLKDKTDSKLSDKGKEYLQITQENTKRMDGMINSLLDYSRIGLKNTEFREIDLNEVVDKAKSNLYKQINENNAKLIIKNKDSFKVAGDKPSLIRLFQNLISNSIKYRSDADPEISIETVEADQYISVLITDNGIGIKEKDKEKVFHLFNRVSTKKRNEESHGVGLAICKRIVKNHGGSIALESEFDKGTQFHIKLPKKVAK